MKGKLISVSGIDGVGKTTVIDHISRKMSEDDIDHIISYDPHKDLPISKIVRKLVKTRELPDEIICGLITSARAETCQNIIVPALEKGKHVITHRFLLDSIAYQERKLAIGLHKILCNDIKVDCQIILDAPVEVCKDRLEIKNQGEITNDIFDNSSDELFEGRRSVFAMNLFSENTHFIDAADPIDEVVKNVWNSILPIIKE